MSSIQRVSPEPFLSGLDVEGSNRRYTIINTQSDHQAMSQIKRQLSPQKRLAKLIDKIWNRGVLGLVQRKLNNARKALGKPTQELTKAINRFSSLNKEVQERGGIPITLENIEEYAEALKEGCVLTNTNPESDRVNISWEPVRDLSFFLQTAFKDVNEELNAIRSRRRSGSPILIAAKTVTAWRNAIETAGKNLTEAEFRALVTQASTNVSNAQGISKEGKAFIQSNIFETWAQTDGMGQQKFIDETVRDFVDAVKNIDSETHCTSLLQHLIEKVDSRATKIAEILGNNDLLYVEEIKQALLKKMNASPRFQAAFKGAKGELEAIVQNNQSHAYLAREQMEHLRISQEGIRDSEKISFKDSGLKGEAAIAATLSALANRKSTEDALTLLGKPDAMNDFTHVAEAAARGFSGINEQLNTLLTQGNQNQVEQGEKRAKAALEKLDLMNELINSHEDLSLKADTKMLNSPIADFSPAAVSEALKDDLIEMISTLAGESDEEASPTLLYQVLASIGENGQASVLGQNFDLDSMFSAKIAFSKEASTQPGVMFEFAGGKPQFSDNEDVRLIANLRRVIREIRQEKLEVQREEEAQRIRERKPST